MSDMYSYRLEIVEKHPVVVLESGRYILDTGSPFTISGSEFEFCGRICRGNSSMLDTIRNLSGLDVDGLIGLDSINGFNVLFDYPGGEVLFKEADFELDGSHVRLNSFMGGALLFDGEVGGQLVRCILDTGAKLSYISPKLVSGKAPIDHEGDFYPGIGAFESPVYAVPVTIGDKEIDVRMGVLPQGTAIAMTVSMLADAVIGYDLFKDRKVALNLNSGYMCF